MSGGRRLKLRVAEAEGFQLEPTQAQRWCYGCCHGGCPSGSRLVDLDLCADLSTEATSVSGAQDRAVLLAQSGQTPRTSRKGKGPTEAGWRSVRRGCVQRCLAGRGPVSGARVMRRQGQ